MDKETNEYVEVLYNNKYGGFGFSLEFFKEYAKELGVTDHIIDNVINNYINNLKNKRNKKKLNENEMKRVYTCIIRSRLKISEWNEYMIKVRTDPIVVSIFKRLGEKANGPHARIVIDTFPKVFKDYLTISDYDGLENVHIDINKFFKEKFINVDNEMLTIDYIEWLKDAMVGYKFDDPSGQIYDLIIKPETIDLESVKEIHKLCQKIYKIE